MDGETLPVGRDKDPFWDPVEDIFLGRSVSNSPVQFVQLVYIEVGFFKTILLAGSLVLATAE